MLVLTGIALLAGLITALSPCVLPVLPLVLAASAASESRWRPLAIVAGLVVSFTTFTLAGAALLSALGLPQDTLRKLAIAMLFVLSASLLSTRVARAILMVEPPSMDKGEMTDKGSINQRAVLKNRAALVDELYATPLSSQVIATDGA